MLHHLGYSVYCDAETLSVSSLSERQVILGSIINGMVEGDMRAGNTAYCLGRDLTDIPECSPTEQVSFETPTSHGKLKTSMSLNLTRDTNRLQGFISAIKRWPEQTGVIDVGCGPFPILALAAAIYHPHAEISAIEMHQEAANAAEEIVRHFGLSDRLHVVNADIAHYDIDPNASAAITETFNSALQEEPGPKIVRLLDNSGIPIITPSKATLRLTLPNGVFTRAVDLRYDTHASIDFNGWVYDSDIHKPADLKAEYYDDFGLVLAYGTDTISNGLHFNGWYNLRKAMAKAGNSGQLVYELGAHPFTPEVHDVAPTKVNVSSATAGN